MRLDGQRLPNGGHDGIGHCLHALDVQVAIERHVCHHDDLARAGDDRFEVDDLVDARGGLDSLDERLLRRRGDRATSHELTSAHQQGGRDHDEEDTDAGAGQGVEDGCAGCLVHGQAEQRECRRLKWRCRAPP